MFAETVNIVALSCEDDKKLFARMALIPTLTGIIVITQMLVATQYPQEQLEAPHVMKFLFGPSLK